MKNFKENMFQGVTLWRSDGVDRFDRPFFSSPVHILGRWQNKFNMIRDVEGREIISKAEVYLDTEVVVGDYIALGYWHTDTPRGAGGSEVRALDISPDLDGKEQLIKAYI